MKDLLIWIIAHLIIILGILYIMFLINDQFEDNLSINSGRGKKTATNILGYRRI